MIGVAVLGSTGSIGDSTLDVLSRHPDRFRLVAVAANRNAAKLAQQVRKWRPRYAVLADKDAAVQLREMIGRSCPETEILAGEDALVHVAAAPEAQYVMAAIVGAAGLPSALAAARAGKRVLLANKEALVVAGRLFMDAVRESGAELLPIDSEHNAIFQCLPHGTRANGAQQSAPGVRRLLLTASGGPFRTRPLAELASVTPEQACAHPNWSMGRKISVDSATMLNKGLEVIEAHWLFSMPPDRIDVLIHPQSVVHSMVEYDDGSVLAQLGQPDMRTPIAYGLAFPERIAAGVGPLDLARLGRLDFEAPDFARFPCLRLAFEALRAGQGACVALNAANEVAVEAFLQGAAPYTAIAAIIDTVLQAQEQTGGRLDSLEGLLDLDREARMRAREALRRAAGA